MPRHEPWTKETGTEPRTRLITLPALRQGENVAPLSIGMRL